MQKETKQNEYINDSDSRQREAETLGTQFQTIIYLNRNPLIAIITFTLVIMTAALWTQVLVEFLTKQIFHLKRPEDITTPMWFLSALTFSVIAYIIIRKVFDVPLTAAYSL